MAILTMQNQQEVNWMSLKNISQHSEMFRLRYVVSISLTTPAFFSLPAVSSIHQCSSFEAQSPSLDCPVI